MKLNLLSSPLGPLRVLFSLLGSTATSLMLLDILSLERQLGFVIEKYSWMDLSAALRSLAHKVLNQLLLHAGILSEQNNPLKVSLLPLVKGMEFILFTSHIYRPCNAFTAMTPRPIVCSACKTQPGKSRQNVFKNEKRFPQNLSLLFRERKRTKIPSKGETSCNEGDKLTDCI